MNTQQKLYDVYVSYPPGVDQERINACLYDNLPENEAADLIQALSERPQAIIAENCTQGERENAQQYFNYLGLDVVVRQSLELQHVENNDDENALPEVRQCPVCKTIAADPEATECILCHLNFASATDAVIQRKRIEWEEKLVFEHKKQTEIAHKLELERQEEEKRLRKQVRQELEEKLRAELGTEFAVVNNAMRRRNFLVGVAVAFGAVVLVAAGYLAAKYL
ncbi:hypothetical protein [Neisseria sp.]|uniref:hypothetical protein n=1 Tax=Neisseria sp. TaxID=192066 RepID=UPI0035A109AD